MLKRTVPAGLIAPWLNRSAALQADCNSFYLNVEDATAEENRLSFGIQLPASRGKR